MRKVAVVLGVVAGVVLWGSGSAYAVDPDPDNPQQSFVCFMSKDPGSFCAYR